MRMAKHECQATHATSGTLRAHQRSAGRDARLRRFILDLAVQGKLVEQNPNDEPAVGLLKRIQAEKARLVIAGKAGKQAPFEALIELDLARMTKNACA